MHAVARRRLVISVMSYKQIILRNRFPLAHNFEVAIRDSVLWAWANSTGKPHEPDFIASLVVNATPVFCKILNAVFAGQPVSLSMASVFCHNKPTVGFKAGACELGDILFVHRHLSRSGNATNQSLLLQAKMTDRQETTISSSGDRVQLSLYTDWPEFEYVRSGSLNGEKRDVTPKTPHAGAQYLLVDSRGPANPESGMQGIPGTHCMAVWPAERILFTSETLAGVIVEFILGLDGRRFLDYYSSDASGWSQVVWDLLKYGAGNVFRRGRVFSDPQDRAAGDVFFWSSAAGSDDEPADASTAGRILLGNQGGADIPLEQLPEDDEGSGVSLIVIDTVERDE